MNGALWSGVVTLRRSVELLAVCLAVAHLLSPPSDGAGWWYATAALGLAFLAWVIYRGDRR